ncbi:MAG: hypothetical protein QM271_08880, partial [Bacillota bacterium]|nr:hypothetical protein [Bacillota bacterium]
VACSQTVQSGCGKSRQGTREEDKVPEVCHLPFMESGNSNEDLLSMPFAHGKNDVENDAERQITNIVFASGNIA